LITVYQPPKIGRTVGNLDIMEETSLVFTYNILEARLYPFFLKKIELNTMAFRTNLGLAMKKK